MSMTSELQRAEKRLAAMIDRRADAEEAQARAAAAAAAQERRDRIRRDMERCQAHQHRYDNVFTKFGKRAPMALADNAPPDYRRKLYALAQTMLPSGHSLADLDPMELDGSAIVPFEKLLFEALEAEAEAPTGDNMPETLDDPRAKLERMDSDTGERRIEWRAKRSFIHDLSRPGRKVSMFLTNRGPVIMTPRSA